MPENLTDQISEQLLGGLRTVGLTVLIVVHLGLALPELLTAWPDYHAPWVQMAAYGLLTLVILGEIVFGKARGRYARCWLPIGLACTLVAAVTATAQVAPDNYFSNPHWPFLEAGWIGVVMLLERNLSTVLTFLGCHLGITAVQLLIAGVPTRQTVAGMAVSALAICGFQMTGAVAARLLQDRAAAASDALAEEERWRTRAAVAEQVHVDQRERYRGLGARVLPLLVKIADGSGDPADDELRRRCAVEAARLRRLFAENDHARDPLLHELRACIDVAERQGLSVQLAVRGELVALPRHLRRSLTEPALAVLLEARETARATIVRGGGRVRASVVIDVPDAAVPDALTPEVRIRSVTGDGRLWMEASVAVPDSSDDDAPDDAASERPFPVPRSPSHSSSSDTNPS